MALNRENLFLQMVDPPIHKILDQILKVFVAEMYLLSLLRQLKWSLNFLPKKLLYQAVISHIALLVKGKQNTVRGEHF